MVERNEEAAISTLLLLQVTDRILPTRYAAKRAVAAGASRKSQAGRQLAVRMSIQLSVCVSIFATVLPGAIVRGQSPEAATVDAAVTVLDEIMAVPNKKIPHSLLADAQGLAIIPNMVKGGFIVGIRHGRGLVVVRDEQGTWKPPVFVSLTGGSVGWQAGLQATDVVLVFKTRKSVDGLMRGKFTIGADAAVAAGPVGRQAAAATDTSLGAEILSYSRSRGLFAGVSLDGSALQIDQAANQAYYQGTGYSPNVSQPGQPAQLPPSAVKLLGSIVRYTSTPDAAPANVAATAPGSPTTPVTAMPLLAGAAGQADAAIRQQLGVASQKLQGLLDENWKSYLALPNGTAPGGPPPTLEALTESLTRFDSIAKDPRYVALTQRPEFQAVQNLLRQYLNSRKTVSSAGLSLPTLPIPPGFQPANSPRY